MGTCVSTVFRRGAVGPRRKDDPKEKTPVPSSKEPPGKANGEVPPDSVNGKYLPEVHTELFSDGIHRGLLSNGIHNKHSPDEENNVRVPDDSHHEHLSNDADNIRVPDDTHHNHPPNDADNKTKDVETKRRALLVGITYTNSWNTWSQLDGPHDDVDQYQDLLINTYGYSPDEIVVLKDIPELPEQRKPTQVNLIRELKALVSDAEPGDKFTFFYSGHSDQQDATSDLGEEDDMDETLITSDEKVIVDNELKRILVDPLPVGCNLLAILDTCHSGTMLDLPHYHCNNIYVPWQSKGERRTMTMQNINVRRQATVPPLTFETAIDAIEGQSPTTSEPLQVDTQIGDAGPADQRRMSPRGRPRARREAREQMLFGSQTRFASPEARFVCDGWCKYSGEPHPNVLSLSACSDLQRAWEGPKGSLTTVLCSYLKKHSRPSYGALMAHINFELHDNALALHEYTRHERKKHSGFDGELDNFQQPELSSLGKLNMDDILQL